MPHIDLSVLIAVAVSGAYLCATETAQRGLRPDDYYALELVSDPQLSPDGRRVAYTVGTIDQRRNRKASSIWLGASDGNGAPRQFTTAASATHPRWKPDGQSLAFLSTRPVADGAAATPTRAQVYSLSMQGGEAVQLTDFPDGVSGFEWSPDGARLACDQEPRGENKTS